ncbi:MAG: dehydrogenase [Candidatus Saccharibacteria bacterium]|nr:dehydrogenase [Candidatus Saccharibacteria bacterium]
MTDKKTARPDSVPGEQQSKRPGHQSDMTVQPASTHPGHVGTGKLRGKVALITGGDSGIGRAVAVAFAREGADIAISYLEEHEDAKTTAEMVEKEGQQCIVIPGDLGQEDVCQAVMAQVIGTYAKLDILVNNAAEQHPQDTLAAITTEQLERTFRSNIFSMFFMSKAALPHLKQGSIIINTTSVTAYKGSPQLLDYSSTKGAIVAFTRSLSLNLAKNNIRVNAVAPGPIWTPLIPSTFPKDKVEQFGKDVPMGRPGQPEEVAMSYVFLASDDSSYISGQTLHPNGGTVVNG